MASLYRSMIPALLMAAACAPAEVTVTEADLETIRSNRAAYAAAVIAGNHDAVADLYTENGVVMPSYEPMYRGRMAYRESLNNAPAIANFSMTGEEMTALGGDAVLVTGQFAITLMPPGGDIAISDQGKFLEVWVRQEAGWKLGWDIWNSDSPPMMPPPVPEN